MQRIQVLDKSDSTHSFLQHTLPFHSVASYTCSLLSYRSQQTPKGTSVHGIVEVSQGLHGCIVDPANLGSPSAPRRLGICCPSARAPGTAGGAFCCCTAPCSATRVGHEGPAGVYTSSERPSQCLSSSDSGTSGSAQHWLEAPQHFRVAWSAQAKDGGSLLRFLRLLPGCLFVMKPGC